MAVDSSSVETFYRLPDSAATRPPGAALAGGRTIPIVVLTSDAGQVQTSHKDGGGNAAWLLKPVRPTTVASTILRALADGGPYGSDAPGSMMRRPATPFTPCLVNAPSHT